MAQPAQAPETAAPKLLPRIPSIQIFVRHSPDCRYREDESWRRCQCRKHLRWTEAGQQFRQSARTRSWTEAEEAKRKLEAQFAAGAAGTPAPAEPARRKTIEYAIELFLREKRTQGVSSGVLKKYERELNRLKQFMASRSKNLVEEIEVEDLTNFRAEWDQIYPSSQTRGRVQDRLRAFLRYCFELRWIDRVPRLSSIKVEKRHTLPLTDAEYSRLLKHIPAEFPEAAKARKVRALVELMRWSGLAIQDAVTIEREKIQLDRAKRTFRIVTKRMKTGTDVSVLIPPAVGKRLAELFTPNSGYLFWSGNCLPSSATTNWQHDLRSLFRSAGIVKGHPHRLRDTFAIDLLRNGVPLEEVSKLLGHESIKTTEASYAAWVKSRQDRLDALVIATWKKGKPQ